MHSMFQLNQVPNLIVYRSANWCNAYIAKKGSMPRMKCTTYRIIAPGGKQVMKMPHGRHSRSHIPVAKFPVGGAIQNSTTTMWLLCNLSHRALLN